MRGFSDDERERIREELIEAGRDQFTRYGFDRMRIKDVTDDVEIGTSTFYQFFDSKEMLYVTVLMEEFEDLVDQVEIAVADAATPREEVRTMLETLFEEVRADPLISRMIVDNELKSLIDDLSAVESDTFDVEPPGKALPLVDEWVELESFRFDDPDLVRDMITSLIFTTRAQELVRDLDTATAPERVDQALIETIVDGLFVDD